MPFQAGPISGLPILRVEQTHGAAFVCEPLQQAASIAVNPRTLAHKCRRKLFVVTDEDKALDALAGLQHGATVCSRVVNATDRT